MQGLYMYVLKAVWYLPYGLRRRLAQHFGGFFHQIKERQQIGREDSIQAVCRRMRRLEGFLYEAGTNSELHKNVESN
jgi:hypothetical protein